MPLVPDDLRYTREHTWCRWDNDGRITMGLTDFAQIEMGELNQVSLPNSGDEVEGGEPMGEVESAESVSDLYSPVSGTCVEVNLECKDNPAAINQDPYGEGWLVVIEPSDPTEFDGLMAPDDYEEFCEDVA